MRIESIEIKNFRQYRNAKFVFDKCNGRKDIHIVVGENGEGKTNILNALTWCLYEEEMHLGNKNSAIAMINSRYVQELRDRGERHGEVSVNVEISTEDRHKWTLTRTAVYSIYKSDILLTESKALIVDASRPRGHEVIENKDDIYSYVQRYVPKEINDYIFFDGEHLDDYFKEEKKRNIENGIKDLTQASIVNKAIDSLEKYIKMEISPLLKNSGDDKVRDIQLRLEDAAKKLEQSELTIGELNDQINTLENDIEDCNIKIRGHENIKDKALKLEDLEKESDNLAKKEKEAMNNLMKFTREYYTYFALYPSMKEFASYIEVQTKAGNLPPKIDKKLVQAMITSKRCLICDQPLDEKHLAGIEALLRKLEVSSATSAELNRASTALSAYFEKISKYEQLKNAFISARQNLQEQIEENAREYKELSDYMRSIPDNEQIKDAINKREFYIVRRDGLKEKLGKEKYLFSKAQEDLDNVQKELEKAISQNEQLAIFQKQRDFCMSSISILKETVEEILTECRNDMQTATFNIFEKLIWKKETFSKIIITEDYSFILQDMFGSQTLGSCSAAERALLALSFTLALQEISGHDSLLYIDTPLGRVGEKSRSTFMDVLLDISDNKQVILTFTPTEFDDNVRNKLSKNYSTYCVLSFGSEGITNIIKK